MKTETVTETLEYRYVSHAGHIGNGFARDIEQFTLRGSSWRPGQPSPAILADQTRVAKYHCGFIDKDGRQAWVFEFAVDAPFGSTCPRCARFA